MPSRIIREGILTSERVNSLSPGAELFYRRLMSVVDDFGRFSAHPMLLRASCYPLKLDCMKEDTIKKHLAECVDAGLIVHYMVADKTYLELQDFRQQVRAKESKYPAPNGQMNSKCIAGATQPQSNVHLDGVGVGVGDEDVSEDVDEDESTRARAAEGLDLNAWGIWLQYRKEIGKPVKQVSMPAAQRKLAAHGSNQAAVVEQSIANGWQGLFALKEIQHETRQRIDNSAPARVERAIRERDEKRAAESGRVIDGEAH